MSIASPAAPRCPEQHTGGGPTGARPRPNLLRAWYLRREGRAPRRSEWRRRGLAHARAGQPRRRRRAATCRDRSVDATPARHRRTRRSRGRRWRVRTTGRTYSSEPCTSPRPKTGPINTPPLSSGCARSRALRPWPVPAPSQSASGAARLATAISVTADQDGTRRIGCRTPRRQQSARTESIAACERRPPAGGRRQGEPVAGQTRVERAFHREIVARPDARLIGIAVHRAGGRGRRRSATAASWSPNRRRAVRRGHALRASASRHATKASHRTTAAPTTRRARRRREASEGTEAPDRAATRGRPAAHRHAALASSPAPSGPATSTRSSLFKSARAAMVPSASHPRLHDLALVDEDVEPGEPAIDGFVPHSRIRGDRQVAQPAQRPPERSRRQYLSGLQSRGSYDDRLPSSDRHRGCRSCRGAARPCGSRRRAPPSSRPSGSGSSRGAATRTRHPPQLGPRRAVDSAPRTSATVRIATLPAPSTRPDHSDRNSWPRADLVQILPGHQQDPGPRLAPPTDDKAPETRAAHRAGRGLPTAVAATASTPRSATSSSAPARRTVTARSSDDGFRMMRSGSPCLPSGTTRPWSW